MNDYLIVESERQGNCIIHKVASGGVNPDIFKWAAIRAGLSWPSPNSPGFYILIGEEYLEESRYGSKSRGKLQVFAEKNYQSLFLDGLFKALTDDCALYHCGKIYTDLPMEEDDNGEASLYREYAYLNHIPLGRLEEAPYSDNFALGVSLIKRWQENGLLVLPEDSLVRRELKILTKEDLADKPEIRFPAINALRFVISAFEKFKPSSGTFRPKRNIHARS